MKKIFAALFALFTLCGCADSTPQKDAFTVYTSFYAMENFTEMIAGDKAEIVSLISPGVEAHDWEPSTHDMIGLENADVFIYNGLGMEPWADDILSGISNKNLLTVKASDGIMPLSEGSASDPHCWLNPENAQIELSNITDALCQKDPENAEYYKANFDAAKAKIDELDKAFSDTAAKINDEELIVTHGAFAYLCDAYGFRQYAIEGTAGESDPSSAAIREVTDYIKNNSKTVIFYVESEGDKLAKMISEQTGAALFPLNPFEGGSSDKDYFEVMNENLGSIRSAFLDNEQ